MAVYSTNLIFYTIVILILLAVGAYVYYKYYYVAPDSDYITLINNPTTFKGDYQSSVNLAEIISNRTNILADGSGYGLSIILDMYISNYSSNMAWGSSFTEMKPILNLDDNLMLMYQPSKGHLFLVVKFINALGEIVMTEIDLGVVPLQKWCKNAIIIDENKIVYVRDGTLVKSKTINYIPIIKGMNVSLGKSNHNFGGKVRTLQLVPRPLAINEVI